MNALIPSVLLIIGSLFILGLWIRFSIEKSIEKKFQDPSSHSIVQNLEAILALAKNALRDEAKHINEALDGKEKTFKTLVSDLEIQVKEYQREIRATEQDRAVKFSEIVSITSRLSSSTEKLNKVLNTNNLRGQWGERIADDILKTSGLVEGVHYKRNEQLETSTSRPDFTFFLPDESKLNLDVKFPISNLIKAEHIEDTIEKKQCLKSFEMDVKNRIQEIAKKDYISPEEGTVDFAVLFVPSESVYAAIHSYCPDLFQFAESKRVVLAAPFSLIAILKIVLQSFRHFHFEHRVKEIVVLIERLGEDLTRFQKRFSDFDDQIEKMRRAYDEIASTSFKQIQSKISKIEKHKLGSETIEAIEADNPV